MWPEDPTPDDLISCEECGLYKHGTRMIWGEGNPDAPVLILLDNPGAREDRDGSPIVCGTRQTLQAVANQAGFTAQDLYLTFVLKRRPVRKYDKESAREVCINHLYQQLSKIEPKFVMCLGNVAVQSFFHVPDADVKALRGVVHEIHGFKTVVSYHPLAVRRRPNLFSIFLEDWKFLKKQL